MTFSGVTANQAQILHLMNGPTRETSISIHSLTKNQPSCPRHAARLRSLVGRIHRARTSCRPPRLRRQPPLSEFSSAEHADRNTVSIIDHRAGTIGVDLHQNRLAEPGQKPPRRSNCRRFLNQMMQPRAGYTRRCAMPGRRVHMLDIIQNLDALSSYPEVSESLFAFFSHENLHKTNRHPHQSTAQNHSKH